MIDLKPFKETIREIVNEYLEKTEKATAVSKDNKLKGLDPYDRVPEEETLKLMTPAEKDSFNNEIMPLKEKGIFAVNDLLEKIETKKTEAPTTEAVNYVSMLKLKKDISDRDIESAINKYGNTYIVYEALQEIAADNNILVPDNPYENIEESIESVNKVIRSMNANNVATQSRGSINFALMMSLETLPDEL